MDTRKIAAFGFFLNCIFCFYPGFCQNTTASLAVAMYPEVSPSKLLPKLASATNDTCKVKLLIKISSIYWRAKSDVNVDSALYYARQAMRLSSSLHDIKGYMEASFLVCKARMERAEPQEAAKIVQTASGEQRVRLLIVMAEHYVFLPGQKKENLNLAVPYLKDALQLSSKIGSAHWKNQSLMIYGKYYFANGDIAEGKRMILKVIDYYKAHSDISSEAQWWAELAIYTPDTDQTFSDKLTYFQSAINLYMQIKKFNEAAYSLVDLGDLYKYHGNLDSAEKAELQAISILTGLHIKKLWNPYLNLAETYEFKGNTNKALYYALKGLRNMEMLDDLHYLGWPYKLLGDIYRDMGEPDNSTRYYKLSLNTVYSSVVTDFYGYITVKDLADGLVILKKSAQALKFIRNFIRQKPPATLMDQETVANAIADCYNGLGNFKMAERYYLEMIRLDLPAMLHMTREMSGKANVTGAVAYFSISKFYADHHKYKDAVPYLKKAASFSGVTPTLQKNLLFLQFKLDSAAGNYIMAIKNYERHTLIKDSIAGADRLKELATLKIQFETEQKEKNIALLIKQDELQKKELAQSFQLRLLASAGAGILAILLAVLFNRFRLKQRNNVRLQAQQETINKKNNALERLVQEKEWLLKEIHHRVKNNLQIVMSLLNSQNAIIKEGIAFEAIQDSQARVNSMVIIHQKLYKSSDMSSIDLMDYITDLVNYFRSSYVARKRVDFQLNIIPLIVDVSIAVPIALILNEAITNSLKYAFADGRDGVINISMSVDSRGKVELFIADNGIGLPPDFDAEQQSSLGINIIRGLTEDIDGSYTISGTNGTVIKIAFRSKAETDLS